MNFIPKNKLLDLSSQTAIVTGGSAGIGYGISYRLAEAGANIVIANRDAKKADLAVKEFTEKGFSVKAVKTDVSKEEDVINLVSQTVKLFNSIDILVNNAGIFPFATLQEMTTKAFDQVIAINLRGVYLCTKYVSEQMIKQGKGGKIINITSIDAIHPSSKGLSAYDASKHGVWGFTKNVALELAQNNIWINAIAPGAVMTPGVASLQSGGKITEVDKKADPPKLDVAMRRMGVPDDVAKVVLFLASDMVSYITGSQIVVDGGYLLK